MNDKQEILTKLNEEYHHWEELLAGLSEAQIIAPQLHDDFSLKDVIAHLAAWLHVTIARLEAALHDREPDLPEWLAGVVYGSDRRLDEFNARIHETHRVQPWSSVHRDWREGFLRVLELGEAIPEKDLPDAKKYPWLGERPLSTVLTAVYEHHHEDHLEQLLERVNQE